MTDPARTGRDGPDGRDGRNEIRWDPWDSEDEPERPRPPAASGRHAVRIGVLSVFVLVSVCGLGALCVLGLQLLLSVGVPVAPHP